MAVPKVMRSVFQASASHSDMLPNMLGEKMPVYPRRSMSRAMSMVSRRRPGTATRLMAGSVCGIAGLLQNCARRCPTSPTSSNRVKRGVMKILFVTSNRLGDAVLSTGLLDHLIVRYPDARITVVCGPVAEGVFARMPNRARTIILAKQPFGGHWLQLWAATATTLWDQVVDIRGSA